MFWPWFGFVLGPIPAHNRRFLAGSSKVVGAVLAEPRGGVRAWILSAAEMSLGHGCTEVLAVPGLPRIRIHPELEVLTQVSGTVMALIQVPLRSRQGP